MHKHEFHHLSGKDERSILNCRGGVRFLGFPASVSKFMTEFDWVSALSELGDVTFTALRQELCRFWSNFAELKPEQFKFGHGSMQVLERINKVFIDPGTKVMGNSPQFVEYVTELMMSGANYEGVRLNPADGFRFDVNKFSSQMRKDVCLVYLDNPNNPTGQLIGLPEVEQITRESRKRDAVVIVDEAYGDYMDNENSAINLVNKYDNLILIRTFTKGYQFASLRVGYGLFPQKLGEYYDKVDLPFPIPAIGSYMAAEALRDQDFIPRIKTRIASIKGEIITSLRQKGYLISNTLESCPIFLMGVEDRNIDLKNYLLSKRILTISGSDYLDLGPNYVRITIPESAQDLLDRLED